MKKKTTLLNLLILIPAFVFCQDISNTNGKIPLLTSPQLQNNDPFQPDTNGLVDVIIEFKDLPMLNYLKSNKGLKSVSLSVKSLENRYKNKSLQFVKELKRLKAQTGSDSYQPQIKKSFHKVFNGISIEVPASLIPLLKSSPLVKKVYPNCKIELTEITPGSFTDSDKINQIYNNEGESIIIAIIDTGIDYTHPALGGGFGPGFKVIGGYDFINKDNDPMDDCGHGTLCAGLIVGNSDQFRGIAPKASLLAFKVIGCHSGWTLFADVTEAVEHCVDLKNTGDYTNNADIVSISLGTGIGSDPTNNPLCTAIDNASELGVTFCVASSNNSGFYSIESPGSAESAITVSACSYNNQIADFNSNGPSISNFTIKPDILAPGVDVKTTSIGGNYELASGTSISCPIVAGIAALIKKAHPEWGPEEIKSALVNTANDLHENVMKQGGGVVDAVKAYSTNTTISPSNLSFGFVDKTAGIWKKEISMTIWNHGLSQQQYKLMITNETPGLTITPSKESITLSGQSKNTINFTLTIDNNILPTLREDPYCYYGQLYLEGSIDTLHIPWAVAKSTKLVLTNDNYFTFILANDHFRKTMPTKSYENTQEIIAPPGVYDLVTYSTSGTLKPHGNITIKENIILSGMDTFNVASNNANHLLSINGISENGKPLHDLSNYHLDMMLKGPYNQFGIDLLSQGLYQLSTSEFSDRYTLYLNESQFDIDKEQKIRMVSHKLNGYNEDTVLENSISDFKMQSINISIPRNNEQPMIHLGSMISYKSEEEAIYRGYGNDWESLLPSDNWNMQYYYVPTKYKDFSFDLFLWVREKDNGLLNKQYLQIEPFYTYNDSFRVANHTFIKAADYDYFSPDRGIINMGICPIYPNIRFNNTSSQIGLATCPAPSFRGALSENRFNDYYYSSYTIKKENTVVKSGIMGEFDMFNANSGLYTFEIENSKYQINCIEGKANAVYQMNFNNLNDNIPPVITCMRINNQKNIPDDKIIYGEKSTLQVSISNGKIFHAYIRQRNMEGWQEMTISQTSEIKSSLSYEEGKPHTMYLINLDPYITADSTAWNIRILTEDGEGNSLDYTLEPAFVVGNIGKEAAPTGDTIQQFYSVATVANLSASGNNIKWYGAENGGSLLADTTLLTDGNYYYATQTGISCESDTRLKVKVNILNTTANFELEKGFYSVYPNPVANQITLVVENILRGSYYILYDSSGKTILSATIKNEITAIDIKDIVPGLYFLRINNYTHAEKIVKY